MDKYTFRSGLNKIFGGHLLTLRKILKKHVTDDVYGRKLTYNPNTDIGATLFFCGAFEKKELELCSNYIKKDSIIIDIGANIGLHSIYFSQFASEGLVISFEPARDTFNMLLRNILDSDNILPINAGVSDRTNIADFYVASDNAYSSLKDTKRKDIVKRQRILCFKLDDLFEKLQLERIDFIKIDVEGLEQNVLQGMRGVIDTYQPIIFCEIYKGTNSNEHPEETIRLIANRGYEVFVFDGNTLFPYEKHDDRFYNYLFIPESKRQ